MKSWSWGSLLLWATGALLVTAFLVPDPSAQDLSSLSSRELLDLLANPRDVVRQAAAGQLIVRAKTVVPDLVEASHKATPGVIQEIMAILEELMLGTDDQVAESAETAIEQLAASGDPGVTDLAKRVLARNDTLRHSRALERLNELGAAVLIVSGNENLFDEHPDDDVVSASRGRPLTRMVVLDKEWQGGDPGLKYVARLFPREHLAVHVSDDAPVTASALQQMRAARLHTTLRRPDEGCLGVSYREEVFETLINGVVPGSPADRAGLRAGDNVEEINGEPVRRFRELVAWARDHAPGEMIELKLQRKLASVRVRFALGSDFGTGICRCEEEGGE